MLSSNITDPSHADKIKPEERGTIYFVPRLEYRKYMRYRRTVEFWSRESRGEL